MDRRDFFFRQKVKESELDQAFDDVEAADQAIVVDTGYFGVLVGLDVTEHSPNNMTVDVTGGTARTRSGQRVYLPTTQQANLAVDFQNVSTAVAGVGNSRILSLFVKFTRNNQFPRTDGNGITVFYDRLESFRFYVKQGAEASSPSAPALELDGVLLCDVTLAYGQTTITNSDISIERREDLYVYATTDASMRVKSNKEALVYLLDLLQAHKDGTDFAHDGTSVMVDPTAAAWADLTAFGNADVTLNYAFGTLVVSALSNMGLPSSGTHKIGVAESTYQTGAGVPTLAGSHLFARLESMRDAQNIYNPLVTFSVGDTVAAGPLSTVIAGIVTKLVATASASNNGAVRIGLSTSGLLAAYSGVTTVYGAFVRLSTATGTDGAAHVGAKASGALSAGTVRTQLDALDTRVTTNTNSINALSSATGTDGASLIGAKASGSLSAGTVRSQLDELDGRTPSVSADAYTYTTRGGTINSPSGISSWTSSSITKTLNGLKSGQKVHVTAVFGISGTPTGAYSLRLAANGVLIDGTELDAEIVKSFCMSGLYTVPSDGNYTFAVQYQNPSTGMANMNLIGSASLVAVPVH
ncbi:hypothetical protein EKK58_05795 [Candidatus Dependentiae bacterium]|nr:MAG: hypothetical protein EKK58_05795 [Candidatus Dependentiae bacterium]